MRPTRPLPEVGLPVTVRWLARDEPAVIVAVEDAGRRVVAETAGGERMTFRLRGATGLFHAPLDGPRLVLRER